MICQNGYRFKGNLADESVPEHRDASSSSHESLWEPRAKVVSGKHSSFTHFPKDRNCDICLRNKITQKTPWYSRAQSGKIGDLMIVSTKYSAKDVNLETVIDSLWWYKTWQHSGYNHTQKFLEPTRKPKVTYTDYSLEFDKYCE